MENERQTTRVALGVTGVVYVVVLGLMIAFVVVGCGARAAPSPTPIAPYSAPAPVAKPVEPAKPISAKDVIARAYTDGNHSYIPLDLLGRPSEHVSLILAVVNEFEKRHPELEFVPGEWRIEKQQGAYTTFEKIFGLWVDHRPKK